MSKKKRKKFRPIYIRQWREHRGLTQEELAGKVDRSLGWVSQIETGQIGYTQEVLDLLAVALGTDPASLIVRNPLQPAGIWTIWDRALPAEREQIVSVAEALTKKRA